MQFKTTEHSETTQDTYCNNIFRGIWRIVSVEVLLYRRQAQKFGVHIGLSGQFGSDKCIALNTSINFADEV